MSNALIKKARVQIMKELAIRFKNSKINKKKRNYFNNFYEQLMIIYSWLKKESGR